MIEKGGFIIKYGKDGEEDLVSEAKPTFTDHLNNKYIVEKTLTADISIIKAWKADTSGNLIYWGTANNFNQDMAKAGKYVIAEVEEIVERGNLD